MKRISTLAVVAIAAAWVCGCNDDDNKFITDTSTDGSVVQDEDGDGISDQDEGRNAEPGGTDTDGDTVPDYRDDDSDGDGIADMVEAGDMDGATPPVDSDGDGTPDFRDWDSDDNGIIDQDEGQMDVDGDGTPDFADDDNDGDAIDDVLEIGGDPAFPVDADSDGVPDYMDLDSDNDTITDLHERPAETDIDGDFIPDRHDLDTDGDTIPDATEAGDTNPDTPPVDTDLDGQPDFRDTDSDNDGLSDKWENENLLDPYNEDTDLDGVPDLIEVGAGTDPRDAGSDPTTEGNFYFTVPYEEEPDPTMDTLVFSTDLQMADVFVLMDTTGSMSGEISNLQSSLTSTIIPDVAAIIPDAWFGAGHFDDYPVSGYGGGSDVVFELLQEMTNDIPAVNSAVMSMSAGGGSDGPESDVPALYATATGDGFGTYLAPQTACDPGEFGYPCFRDGSVPIVVLITDAEFHNGPGGAAAYTGITPVPPTYDETVTALLDIHAKVIAIWSEGGYGDITAHCTAIATDSGAVDVTGTPLVFSVDSSGTGLGAQVVDAIEILAHQVPIDISARSRDDETDLVDATIFIDHVEPNAAGGVSDPGDPSVVCVGGLTVGDSDGDTSPDEFLGVLPGTTVCFDIYPAMNTTVEPTEEPQVFLAYIDVVGDGITVLDSRDVYFLVPPEFEGGGPD